DNLVTANRDDQVPNPGNVPLECLWINFSEVCRFNLVQRFGPVPGQRRSLFVQRPASQSAVDAARDDFFAAGNLDDRRDGVDVPVELGDLFPGGQVPQFQGLVGTGGDGELSIGGDDHAANGPAVCTQRFAHLGHAVVPDR